MKPIGFTNQVPGDETTALVEVFDLTAEQVRLNVEGARLRLAIELGRTAERELSQLMKNCNHHVFEDEPGFPYDSRHCVICGASMGLV